MRPFPPFVRPLVVTQLIYLLVNLVLHLVVVQPQHLPPQVQDFAWSLLWVQPLYTVVIFAVIFHYRAHFVDLNGQPVSTMNVPNALTLFRIGALPTMAWWFILARDQHLAPWPLIVLVVVAFLTDLLDGLLSRTLKQGTEIGRMLDPGSDYLVLFTLTLILTASGVLAVWLLVLILLRMGSYTLGMIWLSQLKKKTFVHSTLWGKASFFALMVLYAVEIFVFLRFPGIANSLGLLVLEVTAATILVISIVDKAIFVIQEAGRSRV